MESQTAKEQLSFYCNRCDKWVDGIEDTQNSPDPKRIIQVLCDECGSAIRYRVPSPWKKLQHRVSQFLESAFSTKNK
jgi:hypothetical protein